MPRKKVIIEDTTEASDKIVSDVDDEVLYKKRGPKKKIIKRSKNTTLKLNDSDLDHDSDEENIVKVQEIKTTIKSTKKDTITLNIPWIEKYRPMNIDDMVLDETTHAKLKKIINEKTMPNIIITGLPGIGKTTTILCLAKTLLNDGFEECVLELNASDERGIKTVQDSIDYFCKKKIDNINIKHKIVLLDEADNMTVKAQQAINNLMDSYNKSTRFAFTCNNSCDIIEAIQSRCIILRYSRLKNEQVYNKLKYICQKEKLEFTKDGLDTIVNISQGDLRKAINNLQITHNGYGVINSENVYKLCDQPHPFIIQNIFEACYKKDVKTALSYLNDLRNKGYSSSDISLSMINTLKDMDNSIFSEQVKIKYITEVSKSSLIISKGINTPLQLSGCIASLCKN